MLSSFRKCPCALFLFSWLACTSGEADAERFLSPAEERLFVDHARRTTLENGLVLDRESNRSMVSSAATGFMAYTRALMVENGLLDRGESLALLRLGFRTTVDNNPSHHRGWLYHFTDEEGRPWPGSEVSTIDTALFYLGFQRAAETLGDADFAREVADEIARIDTELVLDKNTFRHGFHSKAGRIEPIEHVWGEYSEGVLLYRLFERPFAPARIAYDLPLFVYFYPLCFYEDREYVEHLERAAEHQLDTYGYLGVTATDGPEGYQVNDPDVVAPLALFAVSGLVPEARHALERLPVPRTVPAYARRSGWRARDRLAIDYGSAYIMLNRYPPKGSRFKVRARR